MKSVIKSLMFGMRAGAARQRDDKAIELPFYVFDKKQGKRQTHTKLR